MVDNFKKNRLIFYSINNSINFESIYYFLNKGFFDAFINKINNKKINIFVNNIDYVISFFDNSFPCLINKKKYLGLTFEKTSCNYLLCSKLNDFLIKKNIIYNFLCNYNFIRNYDKEAFKNLKTLPFDLLTINNVDLIFNLLVRIAFANYDSYELIYLFQNYKTYYNDLLIYYSKLKNNKFSLKSVYHKYYDGWDVLINNYVNQSDIIDYFFKIKST